MSVVEQERPASFAERRCLQIPLLEKRRKRSAVDGQSDLVRPGQPSIDLPHANSFRCCRRISSISNSDVLTGR